jgi:glycosyltransferase involved in cell wall biosynthesis
LGKNADAAPKLLHRDFEGLMRIGMVTLGRRGSGGLFSLDLARSLREKVDLFVVISMFADNLDQWHESGIQQLELPTYRNLPEAALSIFNQFRSQKLANRIRKLHPDVLLFPIFHSWSPFIQRKLRDIPSVVTVHDPEPHPGDFEWVIENFSIRQADRCVILSQNLKHFLIRRGIPSERIDVIPHGPLAYPSRASLDNSKKSNHGIPAILFFGRISHYKGLDILIKAYRELKKTHQAQLLIVGEGDLDPYRHLLEGLSDVEIINRWISDNEVGEWFERASIIVLPYIKATQSGVVTIAATYQLPVIATRSGGLPEQLQDGRFGLLVKPGSVYELVQALVYLLDNPDYAHDLSSSLQDHYTNMINWEIIASLYLDTCKNAILARTS